MFLKVKDNMLWDIYGFIVKTLFLNIITSTKINTY